MVDILSLDKVITQKGYAIRKASLTDEQKSTLEKTLEVAPERHGRVGAAEAPSFRIYRESPQRYYVPRQWGINTYGPADANVVNEGLPITLEFKGNPYEYQTTIINKFIDSGGNGLICVPCGKGKTFMAVAIAAKLGKKFLVVVDKEFLMNQWKQEIESLMPGIRIGILQRDKQQLGSEVISGKELTVPELKTRARDAGLRVGGNRAELIARLVEANVDTKPKSETVEYDCTLCMIQTLCMQDFHEGAFRDYGFCIFDECHHLGAAHFSKSLLKIQTKWMLGLSATPQRDDGLTKVFEWFLGEPVYWEKIREPDPMVLVRPIYFKSDNPAYTTIPYDWRHEIIMGRLLTQVVECSERNDEIAKILLELAGDRRRRVLVLSERISHLEAIENRVKGKGFEIGYYIGGMKEEVRESGAVTANILLASYAMASEAMNIKTLNTVILASPRKKVEQSTGRILRIRAEHRLVAPMIVDIIDSNIGVYKNQYFQRSRYYKKCKYTFTNGIVEEEKLDCLIMEEEGEDEEEEVNTGCLIMED